MDGSNWYVYQFSTCNCQRTPDQQVIEKGNKVEVIYLLILISIILIVLIALAYIWAVKSGQYDDLEKPSHDILMDDDQTRE